MWRSLPALRYAGTGVRVARRQKGREVTATPAGGAADSVTWRMIFGLGGLCWLLTTGTAILWMWPYSGTVIDGSYVMSPTARLAQHLLVFLLAVPAYRTALALGWPTQARTRAAVVLLNLILAGLVIGTSPIAAALAVGLIDGRHQEMNDALTVIAAQCVGPPFWLGPLRFFLPSYVLGLCALALVEQTQRRHRESLRAAEFARAYTAARLTTLSAQLQPHFLFNSLNAISALIHRRPELAATMVSRLGDFLRHALENTHLPWVALETDLNGLDAYLAIQRTRFSDRLAVSVEVTAAARRVFIPSLLLQPVVENAIEHGQGNSAALLHVRIRAVVRNDRLCITVHNSEPKQGRTVAPEDFGHGLSNVLLRLQAAYDGAAHLKIQPDPEGGTIATLDLPLRTPAAAAPGERRHDINHPHIRRR
jgi:two-component system, LytTR family, sensor kinase